MGKNNGEKEQQEVDCWKCKGKDNCPQFNGDRFVTYNECSKLQNTGGPLQGVAIWH